MVTNSSVALLPQLIVRHTPHSNAYAEGLPNNYITRIALPDNIDNLVINSITLEGLPENTYTEEQIAQFVVQWRQFFVLAVENGAGILSVTDDANFWENAFSPYSSKINYLVRVWKDGSFENTELPKPTKFILNIGQQSNEEDSVDFSLNVEVAAPAFGKEDCSILDWDDDWDLGSSAWTSAEIDKFQKKACREYDFGFVPRGVKFKTTQGDINTLPDTLSQPKENYQIIFKDDFSKDGGLEQIDHRLWGFNMGMPCNNIRTSGGELIMEVRKSCRNLKDRMARVRFLSKNIF